MDLWGDGVEIGGREVTRLTFRILCDAISAQSSEAVFCFLVYRGKDSRFPMEQNFGPTVIGNKVTGWLYQQTLKLHQLGVKISYSGDSPYLLRLILGAGSELENKYPSKLPLYVEDAKQHTFLPTTVHPVTKRRTDAVVPFRQAIPQSSLVYVEDIRCICPDPVHMATRCVENDIRRIAQRVVDETYPHDAEPIRRFEENLTAREAKRPYFTFTRTTPQKGPGKVGTVSLSGTAALTVIADTVELQGASTVITDLFEGVWRDTMIVIGTGAVYTDSVAVLKDMFPELFCRRNMLEARPEYREIRYISMYDACDLLRKSLNKCMLILRESENGLDHENFNKWAEAYYQCSLLLFGEEVRRTFNL